MLELATKPAAVLWKQFNRHGLVLQHKVCVDVHREIDIGMAIQTLRHLSRDLNSPNLNQLQRLKIRANSRRCK